MATRDRAGQARSQESRTPFVSPTWVAGTQEPGPSISTSAKVYNQGAGLEKEQLKSKPQDANVTGYNLTDFETTPATSWFMGGG